MQVSKIFNVGINPSNMALTNNGRYGYVCNSNNYGITGSDNITVINIEKGLVKETIEDESFNQPYRIAIDKKGTYAYVCNSGGFTVSVINTATNKVEGVIEGFDGPSSIVLSRTHAYVGNYGAGDNSGNGDTISVVNLKSRSIIGTIKVAKAPMRMVIDGLLLYLISYVDGNVGTGVLSVIDRQKNEVIRTMDGLFGPFDMAIKNGMGYITNFGSNNFAPYGKTVSVVDLNKLIIIKDIEVGIQPAGIVLSNCFAYVSNYNTLYANPTTFENLTPGLGTMSIISLRTNKLISPTIGLGQSPSTMSIHNNKIYVNMYTENVVKELSYC